MHDHPHTQENRSWRVLALLAVAQFMVILDVTVVNVALPSIGESLRFEAADLQWVVSAYVLFTGGLMLLGGRLGDLVDRRKVFLVGLGVFTLASLGAGLAWSPASLVAARALQGTGAALLLPTALSLVTTTYSGAQRAKALAIWGAIGSAGAAAGVLLGGILTSALTWEWVFFVNVPIGAAVGVLAVRGLEPAGAAAGRDRQRGSADIVGAAALMTGLVALILAIESAGDHGWMSPHTLVPLVVAAVSLGGFLLIERRARRPLVPPATWRVRSLVSGAAVMLVATGILVGAFFLNTIYLQHVAGASALETGLAFLPLALVILAGAHAASHALPRFGSRAIVVAGLLIATAGALTLATASGDPSYATDLLPGFLALGFGIGMTFVSVSVAAMAHVGHDTAGLAAGLMTTAHEIGAALGVALLGSVLAAVGPHGIVDGYGDGFLIVAGVATATAVVAALALPSVRPQPGVAHGMH